MMISFSSGSKMQVFAAVDSCSLCAHRESIDL